MLFRSAASGVTVVMVLSSDHVDGEELDDGGSWCWWQQLPGRGLEILLEADGRYVCVDVVRRFFRAKAQRSGANGGDACGYRYPLGGAIVATFGTLGLRVKNERKG